VSMSVLERERKCVGAVYYVTCIFQYIFSDKKRGCLGMMSHPFPSLFPQTTMFFKNQVKS
jgi:hypothetical protein